jgi:uncharacterized protein
MLAAHAGDSATAQLLLDAGADIARKDANGKTALEWGSTLSRCQTAPLIVAVVRLLLRRGADAKQPNRTGRRPLFVDVCEKEQGLDMARAFLEAGASSTAASEGGDGLTPLMAAAAAGKVGLVQLLLAAGAAKSMAARDAGGRTALEHAQAAKHGDVVRMLLDAEVADALG